MQEGREKRRLAAIMAADIVGYSRLIEANEQATLAAIRSLRSNVINPVIALHDGRVVDSRIRTKLALTARRPSLF